MVTCGRSPLDSSAMLTLSLFRSCSTVGAYLSLTIRELGFSTLKTNLMTAPAAAMTIILMSLVSWWSDRINSRALVALLGASWQIAVSNLLLIDAEHSVSSQLISFPRPSLPHCLLPLFLPFGFSPVFYSQQPFIAVNFSQPTWDRWGRYVLGLVCVGYPYW